MLKKTVNLKHDVTIPSRAINPVRSSKNRKASWNAWHIEFVFNPLNAELNPICHLLALLGGATIVVVSRLRVNICLQFPLKLY